MTNQKLIEDILRKTNREGIEDLITFLASTDFYEAPASCENYNSYKGGLAQHAINVYKLLYAKYKGDSLLAKRLNEDESIDISSLIIVAILHDICKANRFSPYTKNIRVYKEIDDLTDPKTLKKDDLGYYCWESKICYAVEDNSPYKNGEKSLLTILSYIKLSPKEMIAIRFAGGETGDDITHFFRACNDNPLLIALHESKLEAMFLDENK